MPEERDVRQERFEEKERLVQRYYDPEPFDPEALPGVLYRHYKGGRYKILHVARSSESRQELLVVYVSLTNGNIWVRPLRTPGVDSWTDQVLWPDKEKRQRFIREEEARSNPGLIEALIGGDLP